MDNVKPGSREGYKNINEGLKPEKFIPHIIVEIVEYIPYSGLSKTTIKKSTGNISVMSFEAAGLAEKISPFDTFVQIIEGSAEIIIADRPYLLKLGQGMIIPAHTPNYIEPNGRFKMIMTTLKEEVY